MPSKIFTADKIQIGDEILLRDQKTKVTVIDVSTVFNDSVTISWFYGVQRYMVYAKDEGIEVTNAKSDRP